MCWGLRLQTPEPPASGGFAPRLTAPETFPIANFWLRARCFYCSYVILCKLVLRLSGIYGFPQAGFALKEFTHLWSTRNSHNTHSMLLQTHALLRYNLTTLTEMKSFQVPRTQKLLTDSNYPYLCHFH